MYTAAARPDSRADLSIRDVEEKVNTDVAVYPNW